MYPLLKSPVWGVPTVCEPTSTKMTAKEAASLLTNLMNNNLDTTINPIAMRLFIIAHWNKIKLCAHRIHEDG